MESKEFNLLNEKWLRVMTNDCCLHEVSLMDALVNAHTYATLASELPTLDIALLRLLLAVLHSVFSRVNETGASSPITDADDALDRWESLWKLGHFPAAPIQDYLAKYRERFYLFHPERPFYQVNSAKAGTEYTAAKLNGSISESSNKIRLFPARTGAGKSLLTYAEAARWLIYLNGFDDTSAKPKQKGLPSPGAGWLGKLGLIAAQGDTLFETLMLNLVLLNERGEAWGENKPVWELEIPRIWERSEIPLPDNQAELLTLQSRRLLLMRDERGVTGCTLLGGDFFNKANAFTEQMTLWAYVEGKGNQPSYCQPKRHNPNKQIWREFSTILAAESREEKPGVIQWEARLKQDGILTKQRMARFAIAGVQYGDKDFFATDILSDSLNFHLDLLTEAGKAWNIKIIEEIDLIDKAANEVRMLGMRIEKAGGGSGDVLGNRLKEQFYYRIDMDFRLLLSKIDPSDTYEHQMELLNRWHNTEKKIAQTLAKETIDQAGQSAFTGRSINEKIKGKDEKHHYSLPEAYNSFNYRINKILD